MEITPKPIEHWDAFNKGRESVTLYQIGPIYMTLHSGYDHLIGKFRNLHYWENTEDAVGEIKRLNEKWKKENEHEVSAQEEARREKG